MKINKESLIIENDRIYLRPLLVEDITGDYINGMNDPEVNKYLIHVRRKMQTRKAIANYVRSNLENPSSILFGIFIKNELKPLVGTVHISETDFFHYTASIGICLFAKRTRKKGFASQTIKMVKDYLFGNLGLHYIEAGVFAENINSINSFTRAGFSEWYRVKDKFRHTKNFKEIIFLATINPLFDTSLLRFP